VTCWGVRSGVCRSPSGAAIVTRSIQARGSSSIMLVTIVFSARSTMRCSVPVTSMKKSRVVGTTRVSSLLMIGGMLSTRPSASASSG
jgi:hypothetical protein